jgi:hypothetical protein
MKKLAITIAAVFATLNIFAQGSVNFSNIGLAANVTMGVPFSIGTTVYAVGAKAPGGTTFSLALYYAPYDAANPVAPDGSTMTSVGASATLVAAGTYNAGTRVVAGIAPPGYFGWFQVRAWQTAFGSTFENAAAAAAGGQLVLGGVSSIIRVDTGDPTTVPPGTPGQLTGISGIGIAALTTVPEPAMLGLGLLGGAALLLLRRRK